MPSPRPRVLFLCSANSLRSQMAEGWCRHFHTQTLQAYSAGTVAGGLSPLAVKVMAEAGVDISRQSSKSVDSLLGLDFAAVVSVCDRADRLCPAFPAGARRIPRYFDDPSGLPGGADGLQGYRRVRDEIRDFVRELPGLLS